VDSVDNLFFLSKKPVSKRKFSALNSCGQPSFSGGEKCGIFVEKWKYIQCKSKTKIYKYKKNMYKNKNRKL
jgi:hypothetical protein